MPILMYAQYLDYIKEQKKPPASPETIANYTNALKACKMESFDSDDTPGVWRKLRSLLDSGVSYGAIRNVLILTKATLKLHGFSYTKNYDYHMIIANLKKAAGIPEAYSERQIEAIVKVCQKEDWNLFRIAVLCTYAGLRIRACEGLKYADFTRIEPYGIYAFKVNSKGKIYIAAISEYAYQLISDTNINRSEFVIEPKPDAKSQFAKRYRKRFVYALQKNAMEEVLRGKSPFHSMRKFFAQQLANCGLHDEDIKLLMGHTPESIAYKHYINAKDGGLNARIARIYAETPLNILRVV